MLVAVPMPKETVRVKIDIPAYKGWWFDVNLDITEGEMLVLQSNIPEGLSEDETYRELNRRMALLITAWNFMDGDGQPWPPPTDTEAWARLPRRLVKLIRDQAPRVYREATNMDPNSEPASPATS